MQGMLYTLSHEHDLRFVALAIGICALASLTGAAIAQHSMKEDGPQRMAWLVLAGLVTGLGVWTTHFTAMLGYRDALDIRFDLVIVACSLLVSTDLTLAGGLAGVLGGKRGTLAGALVGLGIAAAHFIDLRALRLDAGTVVQNPITSLVAVGAGIAFASLSGFFLTRWKEKIFAWPSALALSAGVLSLHFIAMSGVSIDPTGRQSAPLGPTASVDQLSTFVVAAFLMMLCAAIIYTWQSERLSRATTEEKNRLSDALNALRESEDHHRAYIDLNPQIAWMADPQGQITEVGPLWGRLVGLSREDSIGEGWLAVVHPDDLPGVRDFWTSAVTAGRDGLADFRYRVLLADGAYRWFRARARPRLDDAGTVVAWYGSLEDIHEQVLAETGLKASEERYQLASLAASEVILDWSFTRKRANWAGAHREVLGYPELANETTFDWWLERVHPDDRKRVLASQRQAIDSGAAYWHEEYRFLIASGDWIDLRTRAVVVRDADGRPIRLVGAMLDVTQRKKAESELHWAAHHDPLTRLPNRALYRKRKLAAIDAARRSGRSVALVVLDLNGFKALNDSMGHAAGDAVLEQTAHRLSSRLPYSATVARLGGDEFALILPDLADPKAYAAPLAEILKTLDEPCSYGDLAIPVSFSAGVAIWPVDGDDPAELLVAADLALYAAKSEMPGTVLEFTPAMKGAAEARSRMLATARLALKEDSIVPFYQPKIDLATNRVNGWEALLRIRGDEGRILPPSEIAAAFGDAELAVQLTDRMLSLIFADLADWRAAGVEPGRIAVNVAAADFRQNDLATRLAAHANAAGQSLSSIDIEVTETVLIGQLGPDVSRMLQALRDLGVAVALDDFGTGYASLTHLQQFPVDVIKIDRSFVERIDATDAKATAVVDAVLDMARRLGMATVAEGIETSQQADYLRSAGCALGQGYLYSRPVPAIEVPRLMALGANIPG
jgi:diguanylate cyclase (GGDEF)-like protein/PAS domain S-box-containing protein